MKKNLKYKKEKLAQGTEQEYILPDGEMITTDSNRFDSLLEVFFEKNKDSSSTSYQQDNQTNLVDLLKSSISKCPSEMKTELFENVVIEGGITTLGNFYDRMYSELQASHENWRISNSENRNYLAWIGGSVLAKH